MRRDLPIARNLSLRPILALAVCAVLIAAASVSMAGGKRFVYVGNAGEHVEGHDEAGWLGVQIDDAGESRGAQVESVIEDSPADRAGLLAGDVIVEFDGQPVEGASGLTRRVRDQEPGSRVTLTVERDGREIGIDVEIGDLGAMIEERIGKEMEGLGERLGQMHEHLQGLEHLSDMGRHFEHLGNTRVFVHACDEGDCQGMAWRMAHGPMLGVSLTETTPDLRRHLGGDEDAGALVNRIVPASAAESAGIQVGDLIVAIDGSPVGGGGDIRRALTDRAGQTIRVDLIRDRQPLTVQATLPDDDDDEEQDEDDAPAMRRLGPARGPRT